MRHFAADAYDLEGHLTDEALKQWEEDASAAGDAATMLIAGIAQGETKVEGMTPDEIEATWPTVMDSSSGEEIAAMTIEEAQAEADTWGSPWTEVEE
jgi:hypothetical protein